ncbi:Uncharacterised protein [Mycobacteroides abscessus subsp. abscessus]|uniref:hypothetical protein n=1 Tax=Mycobacteroides abscessus TaxID=36809 RepID=UPI00092598EB|nr:hypothetical protein [Mycobacteroides abscessus]SIH20189.1 Uncharacterised protein [Mycobacteroides abscessus subsp. abscessus]
MASGPQEEHRRRSWPARAHRPAAWFTSIYIGADDRVAAIADAEAHVVVTEDPAGEYLGWLDTGRELDPPVLIQHAKVFGVQFVYGLQAELDAAKGTVVRLSVRDAEQAPR